jgi:25S rRNA (uracil2634-N3)-methyltransferase
MMTPSATNNDGNDDIAVDTSNTPPPAKRARIDNEPKTQPPPPLYVARAMLKCARLGCVPCRYVVLNAAGQPPGANARPETCLRYAANAAKAPGADEKRLGLYSRMQRVLTVGDGDFSFSLALARAFGGERIVATSYESRASLERIYGPSCMETLRELEATGARVAHGVNAADLASTLPRSASDGENTHDGKNAYAFDRVVWNFPCVARNADGSAQEAALNGSDARSAEELEANRILVEKFCQGAARLVASDDGEVHITHKVGMQCDWGIHERTATQQSETGESDASAALTCAGMVIFDRCAYPAYRPRKALVKKGFPVSDARTFVFTTRADKIATTLEESAKVVQKVTTTTTATT